MIFIFIFLLVVQILFLLIFKPLTEFLTSLIQIKLIPIFLLFIFAYLLINYQEND